MAVLETLPAPPDLRRHVLRGIHLDEIWGWINPKMLYNRHLGFKGDFAAKLEAGDATAAKIDVALTELKAEARTRMSAAAVWRWFQAEGDGDVLRLSGDDGSALEWTPRQAGGGLRCSTTSAVRDAVITWPCSPSRRVPGSASGPRN